MEILEFVPKRMRWHGPFAALLCLLMSSAHAASDEIELVRKSAFILNFARYTSWSEPSPTSQGDYVICVFGHNGLEGALPRLEEKQVQGHRISTRVITRLDDAKSCRLLFFPKGTEDALANDQAPTTTYRVLTISEVSGIGLINLVSQDGRLGFEIDQTSAHKTGITFSSQLLKLAIEVR